MALVQQTAKLSASGVSLPRTFTNAFPSVPTVGKDVLLVVNWYGPLPTSVTIGGVTATLDRNHTPADQVRVLIYRARMSGTPNRNIVFNGSGTVYIAAGAIEVDALADSPLDQYQTLYQFSTTSHTITTAATTQADELVIGSWTLFEGSANLGAGSPATTGYTSIFVEQDNTAYQGGEASFKFVSATGAQSATWTKTQSGTVVGHLQTYKLGAGAPPEDIAVEVSATTAPATLSASAAVRVRAGVAATTDDATLSAGAAVRTQASIRATTDPAALQATVGVGAVPPIEAIVGAFTEPAVLTASAAVYARASLSATTAAAALQAAGSVRLRAAVGVSTEPAVLTAVVGVGDAPLPAVEAAIAVTTEPATLAAVVGVGAAPPQLVEVSLAATTEPATLAASARVRVQGRTDVRLQGAVMAAQVRTRVEVRVQAVTADAVLQARVGEPSYGGSVEVAVPARIDTFIVPARLDSLRMPSRVTTINFRRS